MVGQKRQGLDGLGAPEQPGGPRPVAPPGLAGLGRERRYAPDRALRHVALHRGEAVEPVRADPVGDDVDQARHVGQDLVRQRGESLVGRERLGEGGQKAHPLDAEAGGDRLDPVAEEAGEPANVAHRPRSGDADRLDPVVHPAAEQVEPAHAEALFLQLGAELDDELADIAGDGLGGADRLGEIALRLDGLGEPQRLDGLGAPAAGLVEPAGQLGAEAQRQRRAGR